MPPFVFLKYFAAATKSRSREKPNTGNGLGSRVIRIPADGKTLELKALHNKYLSILCNGLERLWEKWKENTIGYIPPSSKACQLNCNISIKRLCNDKRHLGSRLR